MSNYDVFISYSRQDTDFVKQLFTALEAQGRPAWVDWQGINYSTHWWKEICEGIDQAQNFVLVISPDALNSRYCHDEITHARKQGKRIIPLEYLPIDEAQWKRLPLTDQAIENWAYLRTFQFISASKLGALEQIVAALLETVDRDPQYVEAHTRLLLQAQTWQNSGESPGFHLTGDPLAQAERWLTAWDGRTLPAPTDLQRAFVTACRAAVDAAAKAEAEKEARVRDLEARAQQAQAELTTVQAKIAEGEGRITSLDLASHAVEILNNDGNPELAALLGIRALKAAHTRQADLVVQRAVDNLYTRAILRGHEERVNSAVYNLDGHFILTASDDHTARIWEADYRDFIAYACTRVFRDFTAEERARYGLDDTPTCPQFGPGA
jgi:hypothetical protein